MAWWEVGKDEQGYECVFASYKRNLWLGGLQRPIESLTWLCTSVPQVDPWI